jgi:hypothetical protein
MENANEREVILPELTDDEAGRLMKGAPRAIQHVSKAVPKFTKVDEYTTFRVEYAIIGNDLVVHFFDTPEQPNTDDANHQWYWKTYFPACLSTVGERYFQATKPRLTAKYTEEVRSWFLKAQGYRHILDIDGFARGFFEELDKELEESKHTVGRP